MIEISVCFNLLPSRNIKTVARRCSAKKLFLEIWQISQENTCVRASFLIKLQAEAYNFIKKETLTKVFSFEFWGIFTNTFVQNTSGRLLLNRFWKNLWKAKTCHIWHITSFSEIDFRLHLFKLDRKVKEACKVRYIAEYENGGNMKIVINPFITTGLFLCPQKKSENLLFFDVSRGYRKRLHHEMSWEFR